MCQGRSGVPRVSPVSPFPPNPFRGPGGFRPAPVSTVTASRRRRQPLPWRRAALTSLPFRGHGTSGLCGVRAFSFYPPPSANVGSAVPPRPLTPYVTRGRGGRKGTGGPGAGAFWGV